MQPLRIAIQWLFLLFTVWLGVRFWQFVLHFRSGGVTPAIQRPDGVEAFLPIAALLGIRDWFHTGSINVIHPASVVILLTAIALAFLLRRSFCSWVCPIGTLEELLWKRGFSLLKRNIRLPKWLDIILRSPKYLLLAFFIYFIFLAMPPDQVSSFIASDYNKIADVRLLDFFLRLSGWPLLFIIATLILSLPLRNPFCRFLCPYGALLGLCSLLSPVKVTRDRVICISCGVCSQYCPAYIPVMQKKQVNSAECVGCWRCISHCRAEGALSMKLAGGRIAIAGIVFASLVVLIFLGGTFAGKLSGHWRTAVTPAEYGRLLK